MVCDTQKSSSATSLIPDGALEMELRAEKMVCACQGAGKNKLINSSVQMHLPSANSRSEPDRCSPNLLGLFFRASFHRVLVPL